MRGLLPCCPFLFFVLFIKGSTVSCVCSFVSGAEDGYIRIHHLPKDYFTLGDEPELDEPEVVAATEAKEEAQARGADDDEVEHVMQQAWDSVVDRRRLEAMGHADATAAAATNQANAGSGAPEATR